MSEKVYDDTCAWCAHPLKVYVLSWQRVKSFYSIPLVANYCNEKTRRQEGDYDCEELALSTSENTQKVLRELVRRRRKLERAKSETD